VNNIGNGSKLLEVRIGVDDLIRSRSPSTGAEDINIFYTFGFVAAVGYLIQILSGSCCFIYTFPS